MARQKVTFSTAALVCDANDSNGICDIDIDVKVAGVDLQRLSSAGKMFRAHGREVCVYCLQALFQQFR